MDTIEWDVQVTPNGELVTLNGTLEDVRAELLSLNPRWDEDFLSPLEDSDDNTLVSKFSSAARYVPIVNGIKYLRGLSGNPRAGPGPAKCARVSCSYNSAIWWCNDVSWLWSIAPAGSTNRSIVQELENAELVWKHCRWSCACGR